MDAGALLALLEPFHITDRGLLRAIRQAEERRDGPSVAALEKAVRRYFGSMEEETMAHLAALERRFDDLYQRQYNLQAERSVAQRRLEAARSVLAMIRGDAAADGAASHEAAQQPSTTP